MKTLIYVLLVTGSVFSCQEYKFAKTNGYVTHRKIKKVYHGDHKDGNSAWNLFDFPMSYGRGSSYDSIVHYYKKEAYTGPAAQYFESVTFRYGYNQPELTDYYCITDYIKGRDIGYRFFAYKHNELVEFGFNYPSRRLLIQFDTLGKPMNMEVYDFKECVDVCFSDMDSISIDVDSLRQELLKPSWFANHFEMTHTDSISGLSPLLKPSYPATQGSSDD